MWRSERAASSLRQPAGAAARSCGGIKLVGRQAAWLGPRRTAAALAAAALAVALALESNFLTAHTDERHEHMNVLGGWGMFGEARVSEAGARTVLGSR